jgi:hypothetical protein
MEFTLLAALPFVIIFALLLVIIFLLRGREKLLQHHITQIITIDQENSYVKQDLQVKYFEALLREVRVTQQLINKAKWAQAWKLSAKAYRGASNATWRKA